METNEKVTTTKLTLQKELLQSWYNGFCELSRKSIDDQEKLFKNVDELLLELQKNKFFKKEKVESDEDQYLINTLAPKVLKIILNEFINDAYIKVLALEILEIFAIEFSKNMNNSIFSPIWEELSEIFYDNKIFYSRCKLDATDYFWVSNFC